MIGLALSGGGSRAIAFHLGCLRALGDLGVLDQVEVLSTISGGSLIGAYYAYSPEKPFAQFEAEIKDILRSGLQREILAAVLSLGHLFSRFRCLLSGTRSPNRTDLFAAVLAQRLYGELSTDSPRRNDMEMVIGACDLRTGSAFRFSNRCIGGWRYGRASVSAVELATAVAASAAYPLLLPPLDSTWQFQKQGITTEHRVLLTDGGVYDNLGLSVLEPGRNEKYSIHNFNCDHLIVCSAGHGQESGDALPAHFRKRVTKALAIIHRRVQDSAMNRLHFLKDHQLIKSFALPYLGQQDDRLPRRPIDLITRNQVSAYPTDFAPMAEDWIDRLSMRGEQLTRLLISEYMPDICG